LVQFWRRFRRENATLFLAHAGRRKCLPNPGTAIVEVSSVKGRPTVFAPLIVIAVFTAVGCIFWTTASKLLAWQENDPGTHALLVVLVVWVLIWNLRDELAALPIRPCLWGLAGLMGLGFIWLSGELVFTVVFSQFAVVAMVPIAVLTLLGARWLAVMAFPFFVLLFALPIWSPLVPTLVKWSAKFVELGIRASGVPIYREGAYFVLPSGSWSIADACSGAAFLSTCLLLGFLYAWTIYHSPQKRFFFVVGSAVIGVVGNWIRVYLTMMIAHITDNRLLRDQHETFGWLLFAGFLMVFCWLGWRYRDTEQFENIDGQQSRVPVAANSPLPERARRFRFITISVAIVGVMLIWPLLASRLSTPQEAGEIEIADLSPARGWLRVENAAVDWVPELKNPSRIRVQSFEKGGRRVSVFVGVFKNESWNSKLVTVANQLASGERSNWSLAERGVVWTEISSHAFEAKTGIVVGARDRVLAWHWYWIEGVSTSEDLRAKLQQLFIRLKGSPVNSAWVAVYTVANTAPEASSTLLQEFMHDMGVSLERALGRVTKK
jgi:EpsI family protein